MVPGLARAASSAWSGSATAVADPLQALDAALAKPGTTVVAGSLYLVGAVRAHLVDDPDMRDPDPDPDPDPEAVTGAAAR